MMNLQWSGGAYFPIDLYSKYVSLNFVDGENYQRIVSEFFLQELTELKWQSNKEETKEIPLH